MSTHANRPFIVLLTLSVSLSASLALAETPYDAIDSAKSLLGTKDHAKAVKQIESAIADLEKLAQENPKEAKNFFWMGMASFYLNRDAQAAKHFDRAIELDPKDAHNHFMRGIVAKYAGDWDTAITKQTQATTLEPTRVDCWYELATALERSKQPKKAEKAYRKALEMAPDYTEAMTGLASVLLDQKRDQEALPIYEKLAKMDPKDVSSHYNIGQIHQNARKYRESLEAFRAVVRLDPDDWRAHSKIVQNLQALNELAERDEARSAIIKLHKAGKVDSELFCRDQFAIGKCRVMCFEYFELEGDRAVRYSFNLRDAESGKNLGRISLGSYEATTEHARNTGKIGKDERYFHLDRYYPDGAHETHGFFVKEPPYDKTRELVEKILEGQHEALSSSHPGKPATSRKAE